MKLKVGQLTLYGSSVAGKATAISIPQLHVTFDLGYLPEEAIGTPNILISHGHQDHLSALCLHQRQCRLTKQSKPTYFLPQVCHGPFKTWYGTQLALDEGLSVLSPDELAKRMVTNLNLLVTDDYQSSDAYFKLKGRYRLLAFPTCHRVSSFGYSISERRKKLKPAYRHLSSSEFGELITSTPPDERDKFFDYQIVNLLTYTGDTQLLPLFGPKGPPNVDQIFRAEIILLECTYLQDKSKELTHERGHTHIEDILEAYELGLLKCQHLVLFHFSRIYFDHRPASAPSRIREFLMELDFFEKMKPIQIHLFDRAPF